MTSFIGSAFLAYLLAASFTDTVQLNVSPISKLVDYQYSLAFSEIIPGTLYNGSITVHWAVPQSALVGVEGRRITVKVTAAAQNNSSIFFAGEQGSMAKEATAFLSCEVENASCTNNSALSAVIPVFASALPDSSEEASITLSSEISQEEAAQPGLEIRSDELVQSISALFTSNSSQQNKSNPLQQPAPFELLNFSNETGNGNFLDTLKPEGDSQDPIAFLKQNSLISLTALVIVIIITGAYLLNAKD